MPDSNIAGLDAEMCIELPCFTNSIFKTVIFGRATGI